MATCDEPASRKDDSLRKDLIELERAVAETLGRDQYLFRVIDEALHSGYPPALLNAQSEFDRQPEDLKLFIRGAAMRRR